MEIHQLRYAVALAKAGNFSRAADQCHVSQPSLSQQIQKLEDELGEPLFVRRRQRTSLTPAGERFIQRASRILDELSEARREARETRELLSGEVVVGVLPTIAPYLLPRVVAAFRKKYPGIAVTIHEETTTGLRKLAHAYEIDLAIASLPLGDGHMDVTTLCDEELLLALPARHPLAKRRSIDSADLEGEEFVLMKEGHCLGGQVLSFCTSRKFQPRVSSRSAQIETVQALVQAGIGISLIPRMAVRRSSAKGLVYRSLSQPVPRRSIIAFWPKKRPLDRAAIEFLTILRRITAEKTPGLCPIR